MRNLGAATGITKIEHRGTMISLLAERIDYQAWGEINEKYKGAFLLSAAGKPTIIYRLRRGDDPLELITQMLSDYHALINKSLK